MAINLRVQFQGSGQMKPMQFSLDSPISQILADIGREKMAQLATPDPDYGLFQPEQAGKQKGRWLKENSTLKSYALSGDTMVIYKKKSRPAKVRLIDNTLKTVLIDDSAKVGQIRDQIGRKLGIKSFEEYGLKLATDSNKWLNLGQVRPFTSDSPFPISTEIFLNNNLVFYFFNGELNSTQFLLLSTCLCQRSFDLPRCSNSQSISWKHSHLFRLFTSKT